MSFIHPTWAVRNLKIMGISDFRVHGPILSYLFGESFTDRDKLTVEHPGVGC